MPEGTEPTDNAKSTEILSKTIPIGTVPIEVLSQKSLCTLLGIVGASPEKSGPIVVIENILNTLNSDELKETLSSRSKSNDDAGSANSVFWLMSILNCAVGQRRSYTDSIISLINIILKKLDSNTLNKLLFETKSMRPDIDSHAVEQLMLALSVSTITGRETEAIASLVQTILEKLDIEALKTKLFEKKSIIDIFVSVVKTRPHINTNKLSDAFFRLLSDLTPTEIPVIKSSNSFLDGAGLRKYIHQQIERSTLKPQNGETPSTLIARLSKHQEALEKQKSANTTVPETCAAVAVTASSSVSEAWNDLASVFGLYPPLPSYEQAMQEITVEEITRIINQMITENKSFEEVKDKFLELMKVHGFNKNKTNPALLPLIACIQEYFEEMERIDANKLMGGATQNFFTIKYDPLTTTSESQRNRQPGR